MSVDLAVNSLLKSIVDGVEKSASRPPTDLGANIVPKSAVEKLSLMPPVEPAVSIMSGSAIGVESGSAKPPLLSKLPASSMENGLSKPPVETGANVATVDNVKKSSIISPSDSAENNVLKVVVDNLESSSLKPPLANTVSNSAVDGVQSSSSKPPVALVENVVSKTAAENVENGSLMDDMIEEHTHWKQAIDFLDCDPFLHHVNECSNWFNNSLQIVRHQSRPCIRPQALTTVTCAFGNLMAPKLVKCLEDSKLCVRQKALLWIVELVATPQGRYQCIKAGLLKALMKRLDEQDMLIKQQIALAASNLAGMQDACVEMSQLGVIKWLLKMVASSDEKLRESSLSALLNASFNETVRLELVHEELTIPFIMKTSKEIVCERCATLGLKILQRSLAGGTDKIAISKLLSVDAIPMLMTCLRSSDEDLQEASMRLLGLLSMHSDGKCQAQSLFGIEALLQFLKKDNVSLQTAATSALMSLTVNIEAKKDFIAGNGVATIVPFIDSGSKILSFNTLQLATNIAEHPNGRSQLQNQIRKVQNLMDTSDSQIQKTFAKAGLQQLKFKHRPFT